MFKFMMREEPAIGGTTRRDIPRSEDDMVKTPLKNAIADALEEIFSGGDESEEAKKKVGFLKGALATLNKIDMTEVGAPENIKKLRDEAVTYGISVPEIKFED